MYAGTIPWIVGSALWLESWAAVLTSLLVVAVIVVRIGLEERFLVEHLEGYAAYRERVKFRLLPPLW